MNGRKLTALKRRLFQVLEAGQAGDSISRVVDTALVVLIIANVLAVLVGTVDSIADKHGSALTAFEWFSVAIFSIEYGLRLWVCERNPIWRSYGPFVGRLRFAMTPMALIDLVAILPFYLAILIPGMDLRALRVFRLLRLFKLVRYSPALVTMGRVVALEWRALSASLLVMMALLVTASTAMYYVEGDDQPEAFASIPAAMWWAVATLTTVGYGDVVPVTFPGRLIGGIVMVFGLGMFALPIDIIASGFANEIHRREFVITWGMVAKVPLFEDLNAVTIARIASALRSRSVRAKERIYSKGDPADAMYFVASGQVEIRLPKGAVRFEEGEFFGEVALLEESDRASTAVALTDCRLMVLDSSDFRELMRIDPDLRKTIRTVSDHRIKAWEQEQETNGEGRS